MPILITRPAADAAALAERLQALGAETLIEPMLTIKPLAGAALELDGVQAVLVTSANGARALSRATPRRDVPVFAVGEASAECARELGFTTVTAAGGDVEALAREVSAALDPVSGALLHVSGAQQAGDLVATLQSAGFTAQRAVLYEAQAAEALSPRCVTALQEGAIDCALFFSPRSGAIFARLIRQAGLARCSRRIEALCLSPAVARSLDALEWRSVRTAAAPDQEALLALLPRVGVEP